MKHIVSSERVDCERKVPVDLACLLLLVLAAYPIACLILSILSVKLSIISRTISHHSLESMALAGLHFSVFCFLPASS